MPTCGLARDARNSRRRKSRSAKAHKGQRRDFFAESDREWILAGANVHVSMIAFDNGTESVRTLDGEAVPEIHARIYSTAADVTTARRLAQNLEIAFMGDTKGGAFDFRRSGLWKCSPSQIRTGSQLRSDSAVGEWS